MNEIKKKNKITALSDILQNKVNVFIQTEIYHIWDSVYKTLPHFLTLNGTK